LAAKPHPKSACQPQRSLVCALLESTLVCSSRAILACKTFLPLVKSCIQPYGPLPDGGRQIMALAGIVGQIEEIEIVPILDEFQRPIYCLWSRDA